MFSSLPLIGRTPSGRRARVDLSLQTAGGAYEAASSGVPATLPASADGTVQFTTAGFGFSLPGESGPGTSTGSGLFFANSLGVADAVDTALAPQADGVEVSWVLRSAASPSDYTIRFTLPAGASLRLTGPSGYQAVEIVMADGTQLGTVLPPAVTDAVGQTVPTSYSVSGSTVVMHVNHSGKYVYPILADPLIAGTLPASTGNPFSTWQQYRAGLGASSFLFPTYNTGYGYIVSPASCALCALSDAQFNYPALSGAYIYDLQLDGIYSNGNFNDEASGIYNPATGNYAAGSYEDTITPGGKGNASSSTTLAGRQQTFLTPETGVDSDFCAGGQTTGQNTCPFPAINSSIGANNTAVAVQDEVIVPDAAATETAATGYVILESDNTTASLSPTVQHSNTAIGNGQWINGGQDTVTVTGSIDSASQTAGPGLGLGVAMLGTTDPPVTTLPSGGLIASHGVLACNDPSTPTSGTPTGFPCVSPFPCTTLPCSPTTPSSTSLTYYTNQLPEGITTLYAQDSTAAYHVKTATATTSPGSDVASWQVKVDRTPPVISASGPIAEDASVGGSSGTLIVSAQDSVPGIETSGVKSIQVTVSGDSSQPASYLAPACPAGSCDVTDQNITVPFSNMSVGTHTVTITATDNANNQSTTSFTFVYNDETPSITLTGPAAANGAYLPVGGATLTVDATEPNSGQPGVGIATVDLAIDGTDFEDRDTEDCVDESPMCDLDTTFDLDDADLTPGPHTLTLTTTDLAGNQVSQSWTVYEDQTPPTVTLGGSLPTYAGEQLPAGSYTLTASATDAGSGVASLTVDVDGNQVASQTQTCGQPGCPLSLSYVYNTSNFSAGPHDVVVEADDGSGNAGFSSDISLNPAAPQQASASTCSGTAAEQTDTGTDAPLQTVLADLGQYASSVLTNASQTTTAAGVSLDPLLQAVSGGVLTTSGTLVPSLVNPTTSGGQQLVVGTGDDAMCLTSTSVNSDAGTPQMQGTDAAVVSNYLPSTDMTIRAVPEGLESFLQMRDSSAVSSPITWQVASATGAQLEQITPQEVALVTPFLGAVPAPSTPSTISTPQDGSPATSSAADVIPEPAGPEITSYPTPTPTTPAPGTPAPAVSDAANSATQLADANAQFASIGDRTAGEVNDIIWAPTAVDANGNPVPVTLTANTNGSVTLTVTPGPSTVYPIEVDPQYIAAPDETEPDGDCEDGTVPGQTTQIKACVGLVTVHGPVGEYCTIHAQTPQLYDSQYLFPPASAKCNNGGEDMDPPVVDAVSSQTCAEYENPNDGYKMEPFSCASGPTTTVEPPDVPPIGLTPFAKRQCIPGIHTYRTAIVLYITWADLSRTTVYDASYGGIRADCSMAALWTDDAESGSGTASQQLFSSMANASNPDSKFTSTFPGDSSTEYNRMPDYYLKYGTVNGLFAAHHIIPATEGQSVSYPAQGTFAYYASEARAIGYLCGLYPKQLGETGFVPNSAFNGIELPQSSDLSPNNTNRAKVRDSYGNLVLQGNDLKLVYHPQISSTQYYTDLDNLFAQAITVGGPNLNGATCNLAQAQQDLVHVAYVLKTDGPGLPNF